MGYEITPDDQRISSRKVLIVNDDNGHAHAIEYTDENMRGCLQHLVDIGYDMQEPEGLTELLLSGTAEEIKSFLMNWNGPMERSQGGKLYVVEVQTEWKFPYGPFS
jgi:hypothetical protein